MLLPENFEPLVRAPAGCGEDAYWFLFDQRALLVSAGDSPTVPFGAEPPAVCGARQFVGLLAGKPCWAARVESAQAPEGWACEGLRGPVQPPRR